MSHALPQPPGPCRIGGDLETEVSTTPKIAEGVTAFDSSYDAGYGLSGVAEDANGAESAGGGSAGTASPHVTDDVSDILNVDQGELAAGTLSASGQLSLLSASAAEFTPGGGGERGGGGGGAWEVGEQDRQQQLQRWGQNADRAVHPEHAYAWEGEEDSVDHFGVAAAAAAVTGEEDDALFYTEVQLEAEMLDLMAQSFSDCSLESLQVALARSNWNLDRASNAVLSALQTACDPSQATKPCRHLLLDGECFRSDCAFSHDFATTPCRYWLQGQCFRPAGACPFMHDLSVLSAADGLDDPTVLWEVAEGDEDVGADKGGLRRDSNPSIEDFPSLGFVPLSKIMTAGLSATATPTSEPSQRAVPDDTTARHRHGPTQPSRGEVVGEAIAIDWTAAVAAEAPSKRGSCPVQQPARATQEEGWRGPDTLSKIGEEDDDNEEEDVLKAATAATGTTKGKGGGGGRKGRRGRKTRFTAINLQTLLRADSNPTGDSASASASSTDKRNDPPPLSWQAGSRHAPSGDSGSIGNGTGAGSGKGVGTGGVGAVVGGWPSATSTAAATTTAAATSRTSETTGVSFAEVVGAGPSPSPWSLPSSSSTATLAPPEGGGGGGRRLQRGAAGTASGLPERATAAATTAVIPADRPAAGRRSGGAARVTTARAGAAAAGGWGRGEWVSTGDAVARQYEQARKEAGELARARNKLFTSATEAFRRGQGMIARDLARRGRELNLRMKEKHRQAAQEIFASRNPGDQVFERKTIDLHGLHVSEAIEALDRGMMALAERGLQSVRVLTGSGHHSKGPTSKTRLIPAVEHFCHARGFPFCQVPDQSTGHIGVLEINFAGLLELEHGAGAGRRPV